MTARIATAGTAMLAAALVLTAGCSTRVTSPGPAVGLTDCSTLVVAHVVAALSAAQSYSYEAHGTLERTGSSDTTPISLSGSYSAPDRLAVVYDGHWSELEQVVVIGAQEWVRPHGSLRWKALADSADRPPNDLLAEIERMTDWQPAAAGDNPGYCTLAGTGRFQIGGQEVDGAITVTTPPRSSMPQEIAVDHRFGTAGQDKGAVARRQLTYRVDTGSDVAIRAPEVDASAATQEDVRYALRHLACGTPPCDLAGLEVTYSVHQPGLDLFGYRLPTGAGEAWFDNGAPTEVVPRSCLAPTFAWHEHRSGQAEWIGGPMTLAGSATLRIAYSDGVSEEKAISGPAYIVPARAAPAGGPHVVEVTLVGADGAVLLRSDAPSPTPGPSPGC